MNNDMLALAILADATVAEATRQAEEARRLLREQQEQHRAQRRENERRKIRRIIGTALRLLAVSVPVWALTPVVGSFVSIASDNFTSLIFLGSGETGSTSGSGPEALYVLLAWLIPMTIGCCAVLGAFLPYPATQEVVSSPAAAGFGFGFLVTMFQGFNGSGSSASWYWPFLLAIAAHAAYGFIRRAQTESENSRRQST